MLPPRRSHARSSGWFCICHSHLIPAPSCLDSHPSLILHSHPSTLSTKSPYCRQPLSKHPPRTPNSRFRVRHPPHRHARPDRASHPVHQSAQSVYGILQLKLPCTPNLAFRVRISKRPRTSRHKAGRAAPGLSCVARFERSAGVFADRAAS